MANSKDKLKHTCSHNGDKINKSYFPILQELRAWILGIEID